jgi:hypothetical protein
MLFCTVLATCWLDEKSRANSRENNLVWENNHNGHLNDFGLFFYMQQKYFLQWPILLPMPSPICSNTHTHTHTHTHTLSLFVSLLSCSLSTTFHWVSNPVESNKKYHWINAFHKELFSFLKVVPMRKFKWKSLWYLKVLLKMAF